MDLSFRTVLLGFLTVLDFLSRCLCYKVFFLELLGEGGSSSICSKSGLFLYFDTLLSMSSSSEEKTKIGLDKARKF